MTNNIDIPLRKRIKALGTLGVMREEILATDRNKAQ